MIHLIEKLRRESASIAVIRFGVGSPLLKISFQLNGSVPASIFYANP